MTEQTDDLLRAEIRALGERVDLKLEIISKDITFTNRNTEQIVQLLREQQGDVIATVKDVNHRLTDVELLLANLRGQTKATVFIGGVLITLLNLAINLLK